MLLVDISNLSYSYDNKKIFNNINLSVNSCEFICILGKNKSGKTTLLNLIKENNEITNLNKDEISLITPLKTSYSNKIIDEISLINKNNIDLKQILKDFELYEKLDTHIQNLSYLENLKLNLIKSIISKSKLILIDSALSFINEFERLKLLSILKKYQNMFNFTLIYTSVNMNEALFFDKIYAIQNKKIVEKELEDIPSEKNLNVNIPILYEVKEKLKLYDLISDKADLVDEMVDEICR